MGTVFRSIFRYGLIILVLVAAIKGIMTCNEYRDSSESVEIKSK